MKIELLLTIATNIDEKYLDFSQIEGKPNLTSTISISPLFSFSFLISQSPTFKDLDFLESHPTGIELETETYEALEKTLRRDVRVLESFKIMDYSLLLGIHNLDEFEREKHKR